MGGVHRARDSRLKHDVAIVSAAQFSERFEREARAVAALNDPTSSHFNDVAPNPTSSWLFHPGTCSLKGPCRSIGL